MNRSTLHTILLCLAMSTVCISCTSDDEQDNQNTDQTEEDTSTDSDTQSAFSAEELAKANTAKDADIADNEKKVILYINLARLDGKRFYAAYVEPSVKGKETDYTKSLKADLEAVSGLTMLTLNQGLYQAAVYHAEDMGNKGTVSHNSSDGTSFSERLKRYYSSGYVAENCSYGFDDPLQIVLQLLIDEGTSSLGHRKNILNTKFKAIGTAIRTHRTYRYNCVQDFGDTQ